jgi:hypothetical protein
MEESIGVSALNAQLLDKPLSVGYLLVYFRLYLSVDCLELFWGTGG